MPSMSSTVAVVESQQPGDRGHGGPRSVKGESPFACISEGEPASRLGWHKDTYSIVFIVHLVPNASICSLARDGRTMPSASSTVVVVESQPRRDRCHGWPWSLKGVSPFACISEGEPPSRLGWRKDTSSIVFIVRFVPIASIRYARWLATAVPCRQRAAQSPLWSHNGGATAASATVGRGTEGERRK